MSKRQSLRQEKLKSSENLTSRQPLQKSDSEGERLSNFSLSDLRHLNDKALLLNLTFDQLRTLVVVYKSGSALRAARELSRDQSSVQSQINTLNRYFKELCGEILVQKGNRGEKFSFTETGKEVVTWSLGMLESWIEHIDQRRQSIGKKLVIATTAFTLPLLDLVWDDVNRELGGSVKLEVKPIHTKDFWPTLRARDADLVLGAVVAAQDKIDVPKDFAFIEWNRDTLEILTNLEIHDLHNQPVTKEQLQSCPLILPSAGIIMDFMRKVYGEHDCARLHIETSISDVHYGLNLLKSGVVRGCMVVVKSVGQLAKKNPPPTLTREPKGKNLRLLLPGKGLADVEIVSGLIARKADLEQYEKKHPLNIFWHLFEEKAVSRKAMAQPKANSSR